MKLNDEERAMRAGEHGRAAQIALEHQIQVGDFFGAADFLPVTQAHVIADTESLGEEVTAAVYLKDRYPQGGPVYIIGEQGLVEALNVYNFIQSEQNPIAVVVGMDRSLTYDKLRKATLYLRSGVPFIATNTDLTFPSTEGLVPGAGAIVAALEAASGLSPLVTGKPSPYIYLLALDRLGTSPEETLVIGDRLETDICWCSSSWLPNCVSAIRGDSPRTGLTLDGRSAAVCHAEAGTLHCCVLASLSSQNIRGIMAV